MCRDTLAKLRCLYFFDEIEHFRIAVELASKSAKSFEIISTNLREGLIKFPRDTNPINPELASSLFKLFPQQDANTSRVL